MIAVNAPRVYRALIGYFVPDILEVLLEHLSGLIFGHTFDHVYHITV
jgi:hypothetical protein